MLLLPHAHNTSGVTYMNLHTTAILDRTSAQGQYPALLKQRADLLAVFKVLHSDFSPFITHCIQRPVNTGASLVTYPKAVFTPLAKFAPVYIDVKSDGACIPLATAGIAWNTDVWER